MNERIKELVEQATIHSPGGFYTYTQIDAKKFAELIVKECADVCQGFGESGDGYTCSYEILEHFGVEE